jgi:hypothetical protein
LRQKVVGPLDWTLKKLREKGHIQGEVTQVPFRLLDIHVYINQVGDGLKRIVRYTDGNDSAEQAVLLNHWEMGEVLCEEQDPEARDSAQSQDGAAAKMSLRPSNPQASRITDQRDQCQGQEQGWGLEGRVESVAGNEKHKPAYAVGYRTKSQKDYRQK